MKECPQCGERLPETARFCSTCRCDLGVIEAASEAEAMESRAVGMRGIWQFVVFWAFVVVFVVLAMRIFG